MLPCVCRTTGSSLQRLQGVVFLGLGPRTLVVRFQVCETVRQAVRGGGGGGEGGGGFQQRATTTANRLWNVSRNTRTREQPGLSLTANGQGVDSAAGRRKSGERGVRLWCIILSS